MSNDQQKKKSGAKTLKAILEAFHEDRRERDKDVDRRLAAINKLMIDMPSKEDISDFRKYVEESLYDDHGELKLASKADVQPLIDFYRKLMLSMQITGGIGKWSSRLAVGGAGLMIALGVIMGGFKGFLAGLAAWALGPHQ